MARYIDRKCPKCHDYFGVTVSHPTPQARELPITAYCAVCGFQHRGWRVIFGGKPTHKVLIARLRKAFR
jgi:hypothetical protein